MLHQTRRRNFAVQVTEVGKRPRSVEIKHNGTFQNLCTYLNSAICPTYSSLSPSKLHFTFFPFRCLGKLFSRLTTDLLDGRALFEITQLLVFHLNAKSGTQRLCAALVLTFWAEYTKVGNSHRIYLFCLSRLFLHLLECWHYINVFL